MSKQITIIGGGNLGTAIAEGLISSGLQSRRLLPSPEEILLYYKALQIKA